MPAEIVETGDRDGCEWTWTDPTGVPMAIVWAEPQLTLSLHVRANSGRWQCVAVDMGYQTWHMGTRQSARASAMAWISRANTPHQVSHSVTRTPTTQENT
jgi:hypothetical protein